jgi:hypothetical protein
VAVSPDGKSVYAVAFGPPKVGQYDVGADGALAPKTPATVATGTFPFKIAVSPGGHSVYVTNNSDNTVSQYDVGAGGALTPKFPATVATGDNPRGIAVTPLPRVPTSKEQCKNGGWRNFPQFKNQGQCVAFVNGQARKACLAERASIGRPAFRAKYGQGPQHRNALRRCIRRTAGG